jgi:hypothetical protein
MKTLFSALLIYIWTILDFYLELIALKQVLWVKKGRNHLCFIETRHLTEPELLYKRLAA